MTVRRRPPHPAQPRELAPGIALMLACVRALPPEGRRANIRAAVKDSGVQVSPDAKSFTMPR